MPYFEKVLKLDPDDNKGHKTESLFQLAVFEARVMKNGEPLEDFMSGEPGEKYLTELLVKAFLHQPDESGAAAAKDLQAMVDEDPKAVAAAISNLVELGEGEMKETLAQA